MPPFGVDQGGRLHPGRGGGRGLAFEHLAVAKVEGSLAAGALVRKLDAQPHIHRAGAKAMGDLVRKDPAVHPQPSRHGQIHRPVGDGVVVLLGGGDAEIEVERAGGRLVHRLDIRLLPAFQAAHRGGHRLQFLPAGSRALPGQPLAEGEVCDRGQEHTARRVDQLQLGQVDGDIAAAQMPLQVVGALAPLLQLLLAAAQMAAAVHFNVVLIAVAAQLQVDLAAAGEQGAVHPAQLARLELEAGRVDPALFLRALLEGQPDAAVAAVHKGALPLPA